MLIVVSMTLNELIGLIGKRVHGKLGEREEPTLVFDWIALQDKDAFIDGVFGDCTTGDFADVMTWDDGQPTFAGKAVPFALFGVDEAELSQFTDGENYPQFHELLLAELPNGPVFAITVDGTAMPAKRTKQVAASVAELKLTQR